MEGKVFKCFLKDEGGYFLPCHPQKEHKIFSNPLSSGAPTIQMREYLEGEEGCDVSIVAKISGCPFPTLTWQRASLAKVEEKAAIQYDQRICKLVTEDKCTLLVTQASRHDTGLYSLTASNGLGTVTKDIKMAVLGKEPLYKPPLAPHLLFCIHKIISY